MSGIKITELPASTTPLSGSEIVPLVQGGVTKRATVTQIGTVTATGTTTPRTLSDRFADELNLRDFGAVGDGAADDTAAIQAWFSAVVASGKEGFAPAGTYKVTSPIVFDYVNCALSGFTLRGEGVQKTIFTSTITTAGAAAFSIVTSGGTVGTPAIGVYTKIYQIGFLSNFAGSTFRVGYQDFSDQQNLVRLECWISNSSDAAGANCLEMNSCYGCNIEYNGGLGATANAGDNLRLRQCSFAHFFVSVGGTATAGPPAGVAGTGVGIRITGGFNYGNVFTAPDVEYFDIGLKIDTSTAFRNTFIGGTWGDFKTAVVSATAGAENKFINPNINAPLVPFAATGGGIGILRDTALLQTSAPATGATVTIADNIRYFKLTPSGTLATLTVNLPANPTDQQVVTIQSLTQITALTLSASPASIFDAVTTLAAEGSVSYIFNASGNNWLRV